MLIIICIERLNAKDFPDFFESLTRSILELEKSALPKNLSEFYQELIEMVIFRPGTEKKKEWTEGLMQSLQF